MYKFQKNQPDVAIALFKTHKIDRYGTAEQDDKVLQQLTNKEQVLARALTETFS